MSGRRITSGKRHDADHDEWSRQPRSVKSDSTRSGSEKTGKSSGRKRRSSVRSSSSSAEATIGKQTGHSGKSVSVSRRRRSKRQYGIDKPLADGGNAGSPRTARSARSGAAATKSTPGGFVDARQLQDEDLVGETLEQTAGPLGVASRPKVIDFDARLKERRRISAWKMTTRVLVALLIVAVIVALSWTLFFSPLFRLDAHQIAVSGENQWVGKSQIVSIADKQAGKSLLLVSSNDVEQELKNIPGVSKAKVDKTYPKGLKVSITAQEPAAMLKTPDNTETAVDGYGRVLNKVGNVSADGIPVIEVDDVQTSLRDRSVQQALKVLNLLPHDMRASITKVSAKTQDSITTELNGGQRVIVWGDASDMKLKKAVVDKIINDPTKIGDKHQVDVSAPLRPIIK
ncbi:FtsQ-type POTRA domain-containing protein [Bifidobacterium sp. ESL0682]|uniref:cell division protein FtsQ/DivIB n=1 Tax=Bifidobacterium sp. ESL0682 TaxID=2983212 RepID=UPI0023F7A26B|nr:FtsQ-type POTRA domain-containing protein [Bifidobacterium sp. ESL0682]WEV41569.1 FtsQ-type POTRA domain-containing protein [Bifidobacterium sp. ESL0682]